MPNLSKLTIRKMRAVVAAVLAEPKFYIQSQFPQKHDCGATCCAAGWTVWLDNPRTFMRLVNNPEFVPWSDLAIDILGLRELEVSNRGKVTDQLFLFPRTWPKKFADQYYYSKTHEQRAQAMAARWEHFIKTDGAE